MPRLSLLPRTSRIVALCSAANFINAADRVIMPIAIVPMTDEFKWNLHWQGWILSAFAFGYFTSQVSKQIPTICDKWKIRKLLLWLFKCCHQSAVSLIIKGDHMELAVWKLLLSLRLVRRIWVKIYFEFIHRCKIFGSLIKNFTAEGEFAFFPFD